MNKFCTPYHAGRQIDKTLYYINQTQQTGYRKLQFAFEGISSTTVNNGGSHHMMLYDAI
jgi:hypothetical protein